MLRWDCSRATTRSRRALRMRWTNHQRLFMGSVPLGWLSQRRSCWRGGRRRWQDVGTSTVPVIVLTPSTSRPSIPEGQHSSIRGASTPLDVQAGSVPSKSPARPTSSVKGDAVVHVRPSHLGQSVATAEDVDEGVSARRKPSSSEPEDETSMSFGRGSQLFSNASERELFWVDVEGGTFSFQDLVQQRQGTWKAVRRLGEREVVRERESRSTCWRIRTSLRVSSWS
ncbi:hypothetical protein M407DRAFT_131622 [Tulasnella calospora MUT 4182]|uniref:Uncharacterized protein n=1 Tax=Tulasnella calospora MUT 4182 TaxID=1051891 RepID=A0A0C3QAB3_9AGAM|nr:hypothetical protein M407DRAFT_131622 [Tulasnella calospora MUT 4182]